MKKIFWLAVIGGIGYLVWRKVQEEKAQRELWTEVADSV